MPIEEWNPSPNFSSRDGRKIIAIVDHITQGAFPGCLDWLRNPVSQASATYIVTKTGRIIQLVKEGDKAWANGIVNKPNWSLYDGTNPNLYTLSIEHEGQSGEPLTEAQYQSTLFLHKELTLKYGIPIDTDHIIGHYRIDSVNKANCPGSGFPWVQLFKDLKGGNKVKKVVVYFSPADDSVALAVSNKLGGVSMFCRNGATAVHPDAMAAGQVFTVGGPRLGHANEVYMSGSGALETMGEVVTNYKGGKF